jgi:hypothetical protein
VSSGQRLQASIPITLQVLNIGEERRVVCPRVKIVT